MVAETVVEQMVHALRRGDPIAEVARALALDRKTVRKWGRRGAYVPRAARPTVSRLDPYRDWIEEHASEVDYNATVLHRELTEQGFAGSVIMVRRAVRAIRQAAAPFMATVRSETAPGEQAQVEFAQVRVWIADVAVAAQTSVTTLGCSRRCFAVAFARQRLREWLAGHEQAFQHFGGVTDRVVVDDAMARTPAPRAAGMRLTQTLPATLAFAPEPVRRTGPRPRARWNRG